MPKPTKKKRSPSEVVSEVMLRQAACACAEVAKLDPSDPRWRRCWRALRLAAIGMAAEIRKAEGAAERASTAASAGVAPTRNSANASTPAPPGGP